MAIKYVPGRFFLKTGGKGQKIGICMLSIKYSGDLCRIHVSYKLSNFLGF